MLYVIVNVQCFSFINFAAVSLFPVSTTWMARKLGLSQEDSKSDFKMTVMTFHRQLESDAFFHISPTCFRFKIWKRRHSLRLRLSLLLLNPHCPHSLLFFIAWILFHEFWKVQYISHLANPKIEIQEKCVFVEKVWLIYHVLMYHN